ncbi:MAG: tetratricopeptide repeat protein [Ignavibacteriales bacterium]|nr:tetratricopeptide repeat protein [Ignavibacteriales bacterium]
MISKTAKVFISFLITLLCLTGNNSFAQSHDDLMKSANKYYQEGNYQLAAESYQKILGQGFESGALYYNLGNAYFKAGKLGSAIYSYEKGLKIEPNDEDLAYNLKIANSRTVDKITELPKLFLVSWWEGLVTSLNVSGWSFIVILIFWILLASIAVYIFSRRSILQKISFLSSSTSLALLIIAAVLLFARVNREAATDYGILLDQMYSVKVSPDSKSNDAFVIHEGIKFAIEDHVNDWTKIRLIDGKVGWIQKGSFGQI